MKRILRKCDKPLLIIMIIFSIFGLLMVFSSSSIISSFSDSVSPYYYFKKQLLIVVASYVICTFVITKFKLNNYSVIIKLFLPIMFLLLIGLFFLAEDINGAKSWYNLKIFNLQPSEVAKVYIIFYFAYFFDRFQKKSKIEIDKSLIRPLIVSGIIIGLIFLQPDLGTAIIFALLIFLLYIFIPLDKINRKFLYKIFAICLVIFLFIAVALKDKILTEKQLSRINFKDPCTRYYENTGYQVCNSFIAINNGGLFGVGLGNSTQKYLYLPAAHTDFIFAIIVEELGSVTGIIIIMLYVYMLYRIYLIAKKAQRLRDSIIAFGVLITFSLHIIINLCGVLGLFPLTGVPLPFLSYGGSFTITCYVMIFLVQQVAIETNEIKLKKEINNI